MFLKINYDEWISCWRLDEDGEEIWNRVKNRLGGELESFIIRL